MSGKKKQESLDGSAGFSVDKCLVLCRFFREVEVDKCFSGKHSSSSFREILNLKILHLFNKDSFHVMFTCMLIQRNFLENGHPKTN